MPRAELKVSPKAYPKSSPKAWPKAWNKSVISAKHIRALNTYAAVAGIRVEPFCMSFYRTAA